MATYKYGSWVGAQETGKVTHRAYLYYTLSTNNATTYKLSVGSGVDPWNSKWNGVTTVFGLTGRSSRTYSVTSSDGSLWRAFADQTFTYTKGHSAVTKTISATTKTTSVDADAGGSSVNGKTSTATYTFTVPAKDHYTVSYNANGGSGAPSSQTKWYGETLTLSSTVPKRTNYTFTGWATSSSGSVVYKAGGSYTSNSGATLYAKWSAVPPPTCTAKLNTSKIRAGFDKVSVTISSPKAYSGHTVSSIVINCNGHTMTKTAAGTYTFSASTFTLSDVGTRAVKVTITDSGGLSTTYSIGSVNIVSPTWNKTVQISAALPSTDKNGYATLSSVQIYDYSTSAYQSASTSGYKVTKVSDTSWRTTVTLTANQVPSAYRTSTSIPWSALSTYPVKFTYNHYESTASKQNGAFYETTRNQNYSNGIYNVMFVSGCNSKEYANYSSRVWWSAINNPLYFPDLNYIEVGSNDTAVQGLTKVGDYLGVVKQSKTTDTAIFLLYPTSFDENTTYAVKQGVQGVGALSRYSFNILGDETLFLSPKGVVAVEPTDDEEHKVQNRSYFVDGKLLAEPTLKDAYSFVYDGKYYLAVNNEVGAVYVLDGNQRNSWGNDKTNLVYECYYLENVPAKSFVKFNDMLIFSNDDNVCAFGDGYVDAYNVITGEENAPVSAEWSTIFDDDNALHYYKTMQKKGNLVSILPIENEYAYKVVEITEEVFNADKEFFFTLVEGKYVRCTNDDVFDAEQTYYIENRPKTRIFVKKDDKEPIEIERKFGLQSDIPSEMFLNKKFKKYKRLQFIIRNDADEDFGVDSIIKNYTVGNYSKR